MATSTQTEQPIEDRYERFLDERIRQTASQVKWVDIFSNSLFLSIAILGTLLGLCLVDAWIFELATWMRLISFVVIVIGGLGYFGIFLFPFFLKKINPLYAAKKLEDSRPELKNSVINYLTTEKVDGRAAQAIHRKMTQKAAADIANIPNDIAVDRSSMIVAGYVLAGLVAVFALYKILSPKDPFQTISRVLLPTADLVAPARVKILDVQPGDAQKYFGDSVEVSTEIRGLRSDEFPRLLISTDDGRKKNLGIPMTFDESENRYRCVLGENGGLDQSLTYRVEAGDATSPNFRLEVNTCPTIFIETIDYEAPEYTGIPNRTVDAPDLISGVEGTIALLQARTNLPIKTATLELFRELPSMDQTAGGQQGAAREVDSNGSEAIAVDPTPKLKLAKKIKLERQSDFLATGELVLELNNQRTAGRYSHFQVVFQTSEGDTSENPTLSRIEVIPDLDPEIQVVSPEESSIELPVNQSTKIEITAVDPDYRLTRIGLLMDSKGNRLLETSVFKRGPNNGVEGKQLGTFEFKPQDYGLESGDEVLFFATAEDNRTVGPEAVFDPNRARTDNYRIVVTDALEVQNDNQSDQNDQNEGENQNPDPNQPNPNPEKNQQSKSDSKKGQSGDSKPQEGQNSEQKGESGKASEGQAGQSGKGSENDPSEGTGQNQSKKNSGQNSDSQPGAGKQGQEKQSGKSQGGGKQGEPGNQNNDGKNSEGSQSKSSPSNQPKNGDGTGQSKPTPNPSAPEQNAGQKSESSKTGSEQDRSVKGSPNGNNREGMKNGAEKSTKASPRNDGGSQPGESTSQASQGSNTDPGSGQSDANSTEGGSTENQKPQNAREAFDRLKEYFDQQKNEKNEGSSSQDNKEQQAADADPRQPTDGDGKQKSADPSDRKQNDSGSKRNSDSGKKETPGSGSEKPNGDEKEQPANSEPAKSESKAPSEGQKPNQKFEPQDSKSGAQSEKKKADGKSKSKATKAGDQTDSNSAKDQPNGNQDSPAKKNQPNDKSNRPEKSGKQDNTPAAKDNAKKSNNAQPSNGQSSSKKQGDASDGSPQKKGEAKDSGDKSGEVSQSGDSDNANRESTKSSDSDPSFESIEADKANLDYARKTTDLVLDRLKNQKEAPDQDLLDKLQWTPEELNEFARRWEKMRQQAESGSETERQRFEDALRSLGLSTGDGKTQKGPLRDDDRTGYKQRSGVRSVPADFARKFRAIQKSQRSLQKQRPADQNEAQRD